MGVDDLDKFKDEYQASFEPYTKPPKVFIGHFHEYVSLKKENNWDPREKTIVVNNANDIHRLRAITLVQEDVYYGATIERMSRRDLDALYEEIRHAIWKGDPKDDGDETPPTPA